MSSTYRVSNPSGNIKFDCDILDSILEKNGIDCDRLTQSDEKDDEWNVEINDDLKEVLEKKDYQLQGQHKKVKYCLHFFLLQEAQTSSAARNRLENSSNHSVRDTDESYSTGLGNLGPQMTDKCLPNQMKQPASLIKFLDDDKQETVLEPQKTDLPNQTKFLVDDKQETVLEPQKTDLPNQTKFLVDDKQETVLEPQKTDLPNQTKFLFSDKQETVLEPQKTDLPNQTKFLVDDKQETVLEPQKTNLPNQTKFLVDDKQETVLEPQKTDLNIPAKQKNKLEEQKSSSFHILTEANNADQDTYLDIDDEQNSILVRDVPVDFEPEFFRFILENESLSGGGKIRTLRRIENSTDVEVTFENMTVIGRVLEKSPLKCNDFTFPIMKKPKVNKVKKESEELKQRKIEVHGIPDDMDLEVLKLYFENRRKSRGGKITEGLTRNKITGTVLIEFDYPEDAVQVVKKDEHVFDGQTFQVNMHQGSKGKCFFLSDVKTDLYKDSIVNFLESKADIWVDDIVKMEAEDTWMVNCHDIVDFSQVQQLCKTKTISFMSDTYPKVSPVPSCCTILTRDLLPGHGLSEDIIQIYFKAGTQNVKMVRKLPDEQFLVTFDNPVVVSEVCLRSHKIMDTEFHVLPYFKNLIKNDGNYEDYMLDSSFKLELMKKYKLTVETMLQPNVKPIWSKSAGKVLKIEYHKGISREEALKKLEDFLQNIHEETINLSAETIGKATQLTHEETPNAIVSLNEVNRTLQIAAIGQDTLRQYKGNLLPIADSQMMPMDSYKISLLYAKRFPQLMLEKYPGIQILSGRNKIVIAGPASKLPEVAQELSNFLSNIHSSRVSLPKFAPFILKCTKMKTYLIGKLKSKKCTASWEIQNNSWIVIYVLESCQISTVKEIFESSIKSLDFGTGDLLNDEMKWRKWKQFRQTIQEIHGDLCYLDENSFTGVAADSVESKIMSEFEKYFQRNTMDEKLIHLEKTQADYIMNKKMGDISNFCQQFGTKHPVTISVRPNNQLCISASGKNMEKASKYIDELIKGFEETKKKKSAHSKNLEVIFNMKYVNQTLIIHQGDITQLSVDALVNPANKEMEHGGGLAKAIIDAGGDRIQDESRKQLQSLNVKSIQVGKAIITSGGDLPCNHIIHAVGPIWNGGNNDEDILLSKAVKESLRFAEFHRLTSIAFPAISAGSYKYPLHKAVDVMMTTIKKYLDKNSTTRLKTISFVDTRPEVTNEFKRQIIQVFLEFTEKKKAPSSQPKTPSKPEKKSVSDPSQSDKQTERKSLYIKKGELEKIKADIIVNSTSPDLDLSKGQLSRAILQAAGSELQTACKQFGNLKIFQIVVTKGFKLPCQKIFHLNLPSVKDFDEKTIQTYMNQCLTDANDSKASSIAFPTLGTGALNYPSPVVARSMLKNAYYHLKHPTTSLREISIIIYPKDDEIFKIFESKSKDLTKIDGIDIKIDRGSMLGMNTTMSTITTGLMSIPGKVSDFFRPQQSTQRMDITKSADIIQKDTSQSAITSGLMNNPGRLSNFLQPQQSTQPVPSRWMNKPDLTLGTVQIFLINGDLLNEQTDAIVHCTDANFNLKGAISRGLTYKSGLAFTRDCQLKSVEMVSNHYAVTNARNLSCRYILHLDVVSKLSDPQKILETCFYGAEKFRISSISLPHLASHGKNVPLNQMAAAMVEVLSKFRSRCLKKVNVVLYQSNMVATFKKDILSAQNSYNNGGISTTFRQGITRAPPRISQRDILKMINLQNTDAEYQKVQKEFLSSLNRTTNIISIEKVENKPLKGQYELQLAKIIAVNNTQTTNERILWHGTKKETVRQICQNGFDRGYCGTNGTYHGLGVYFAVNSEYSDKDIYTPRDQNNYKHMLMCRVATGSYVQGIPTLKVLPTKPNSSVKYDSATNNPLKPTVFIIFNDVQAYPNYHITYA